MVGVAFELLRVNFRFLSTSYLGIVMPLFILSLVLAAIGFCGLMISKATTGYASGGRGTAEAAYVLSMMGGYFGYILTFFVQAVVVHEAVIAYEHSDEPEKLKVSDVWVRIKKDLGPIVASFFGIIPIWFVIFIIGVILYEIGKAISDSAAGLSILLIYLFTTYLNVCLSNYLMLRLRSRYGFITAFLRSITLTFGKWRWWRTMGVQAIMGIVMFSFYSMSLTPFSILLYLYISHILPGVAGHERMTVATVMISVSLLYGGLVFGYFCNLLLLGCTANYYSLVEEKEHVGLQDDIAHLGISETSIKLQEGEY